MKPNLAALKTAIIGANLEITRINNDLRNFYSRGLVERRSSIQQTLIKFTPLYSIAVACEQPTHKKASIRTKKRLFDAYQRAFNRFFEGIQQLDVLPEFQNIPLPFLREADTGTSLVLTGESYVELLARARKIDSALRASVTRKRNQRAAALREFNLSLTADQKAILKRYLDTPGEIIIRQIS